MAALVLSLAAASSNVKYLNIPFGRQLRWVVLAELLAVAVLLAASRGKRRSLVGAPLAGAAAAAALAALALVSTAWSPDARLTAARAVSLTLLFAAAGALAYAAAGDRRVAELVLVAVLGGATLVALAGLVHLALSPEQAVVAATARQAARYNGLGANPNAMPVVLALAVPLAGWMLLYARRRAARGLAAAAGVLMVGSIVASGSRGALLAAFAGLLALALTVARSRRRAAALAAAVVAGLAVSLLVMQLPRPADRDPPLTPSAAQRTVDPAGAELLLPLADEIGHPRSGELAPPRRLLSSLGRARAWRGAIEQAGERPLLGYGFGTEERVFVDRYYLFFAGRVENSYIGAALQIGVVGLVLLLALVALVLAGGLRAVRAPRSTRPLAAACLGVVVCGVVLAVTQSFLTSAGSVGAAPFWLCAFLIGGLAAGSRSRA